MEREYKTKSGVSIYGYKNPAQNSFFLSLFVKAGSMYEEAHLSGISHFLEHVAIRNVNALMGGELYSTLDRLGLEFNASTFSEMIQFYISGASCHIEDALPIITGLFRPLVLSPSEIAAERRRIKAEMRESDDKNSLASFTNKIVFEDTPLASSIVGTARTVDFIGIKRLEEYRKSILTKENVFFYVTGNFEEHHISRLSELVDGYDLPSGERKENIAPVPKGFFNRSCGVFVKPSDFTMVRFTFDLDMTKISMAECDLLYDVLLSGYNSMLFIEMSEKRGLFYDTSGAVERYKNIGSFYFSFEVKEKELYEAIELTLSLLSELGSRALPEDRLMKAGYVDNGMMLFDDARELNFTFAYDNHIMDLGFSDIEARKAAYKRVTPEDLRRAAAGIFRKENLTVTIKGNRRKIDTSAIERIIGELL